MNKFFISIFTIFLFHPFTFAKVYLGFLNLKNNQFEFEVENQRQPTLPERVTVVLPRSLQEKYKNQRTFVRIDGEFNRKTSKLRIMTVRREIYDPLGRLKD